MINSFFKISKRNFSNTTSFIGKDGKFDMEAFQRRFERTLVPAH